MPPAKPSKAAKTPKPEPKIKRQQRSLTTKDWLELARPNSLAWRTGLVDNPAFSTRLLTCEVEELPALARKIAKLKGQDGDLMTNTMVDAYVRALWHARQENFNLLQTSAFITLIHTLLTGIRDQNHSLPDCVEQVRVLLTANGSVAPWSGTGPMSDFDGSCLLSVTEYVERSILQHHSLYQRIFAIAAAEEPVRTGSTRGRSATATPAPPHAASSTAASSAAPSAPSSATQRAAADVLHEPIPRHGLSASQCAAVTAHVVGQFVAKMQQEGAVKKSRPNTATNTLSPA